MSRCGTSSRRTDECVRPYTSRDDFRTLSWHALILETEAYLVCDAAGEICRKFQNETEVGPRRVIGPAGEFSASTRGFSITQSPIAQSLNPHTAPTSRQHREKWGTRIESRGGTLLERLYGRSFVVFHVEYGVELGDLQQIVDFLGELEQFQFAALVLGGGKGADQFADA